MNVTLSPRFEAMIRERIEHGDYASATDVVEEALLRMEQDDRAKLERLRAAVQLGLDDVANGRVREFTAGVQAEIWENGLQTLRDGHRPNPDVCP